ncbi:MAG: Hsp20/alpha crystallin family protein [Thiotrichales bacterium]
MSNTAELQVKKAEKPTTESTALTPFEEMEKRMEELFHRDWWKPLRDWPEWSGFPRMELKSPRVDIIDRETELVVRAELPGVEKKDLDVTMTDNTVTIKGNTTQESKDEGENYYRRETMHGSFIRTLTLPSSVDSTQVKANFQNGVLELVAPKVEKAHRRSIAIE